MKSILASMTTVSLLIAGSAFAADVPPSLPEVPVVATKISATTAAPVAAKGRAVMPDVAKKYNCTACHAIDKKVVGPSWTDVSKKYKGDATAAAKLDTKITKGGSGVWGPMPMPATSKVNDAERKELVDFVLSLEK